MSYVLVVVQNAPFSVKIGTCVFAQLLQSELKTIQAHLVDRGAVLGRRHLHLSQKLFRQAEGGLYYLGVILC